MKSMQYYAGIRGPAAADPPHDVWREWLVRLLKERATTRKEQESYGLAGATLVKFKFEASYCEHPVEVRFACTVLEIDGVPVVEAERKESREEVVSGHAPTIEEQQAVIAAALQYFNLRERVVPVSERYARAHLRLVSLRQKSGYERR